LPNLDVTRIADTGVNVLAKLSEPFLEIGYARALGRAYLSGDFVLVRTGDATQGFDFHKAKPGYDTFFQFVLSMNSTNRNTTTKSRIT
jgi:hypothetical protein